MSRVGVRSEALLLAARAVDAAATELRAEAGALLGGLGRSRPPPFAAGWSALAGWARVEGQVACLAGPGGLMGESVALEVLAVRLRALARAYVEVEEGVAATLRSVAVAADLAARGGWLTDGGSRPVVHPVRATWTAREFTGPGDLVAAGEGMAPSSVRVVELAAADGGSAWVLVVPGTQEWGPAAGANPFDVTSDVRAVTGGGTVAAAGALAALDLARGRAAAGRREGPVLVVGHSQGGILAAALASDAQVVASRHVTHVLTTGSPVGGFPVDGSVRVLSVEHVDDPVPRLDLTPNPERATWVTVRAGHGPPVDVGRHAIEGYVETTRAAAGAPDGTVPGVAGWRASAGAFFGRPVRSVTEVVVERGWQNPRP